MVMGKLSKNDTERVQGTRPLIEKVHSDADPF